MNVIITGSQKRDIGKTIITITTAIEISKSGKNVLMMDLSSGKIKISEYLNVHENFIYDAADVFNDICTLEQAVIEINENLHLLPCPRIPGKLDAISKDSFVKLLEFAKDYDAVVIDADKLTHSYIDFSKILNVLSINNNDFSCIKEINTDRIISLKSLNFIAAINKYNKKKASKGLMMKFKEIKKLTQISEAIAIEESNKFSNMEYTMFFNNDMHNEIQEIVKNLK